MELLKIESKLEFTGEYGAEIATFVPFVAWLKQEGHLEGRRIVTYSGMRPYYFFLSDEEFEAKTEPRIWVRGPERYWPSNMTNTATASPWHVYPDYRRHFRKTGPQLKRPVLFVQNKFTVEWDAGPINFMPLRSLHQLLSQTSGKFDIVYSRPYGKPAGYSFDHKADSDYPDRSVIKQYSHVTDFEETCLSSGADYNLAKLEVLAKSHLFVAVQGGGAHLLACFGDSLMLVLHLDGKEYPHAYQYGPYKYLAKNPPKLLVAKSLIAFEQGIGVVANVTIDGAQFVMPKSTRNIFRPKSTGNIFRKLSL